MYRIRVSRRLADTVLAEKDAKEGRAEHMIIDCAIVRDFGVVWMVVRGDDETMNITSTTIQGSHNSKHEIQGRKLITCIEYSHLTAILRHRSLFSAPFLHSKLQFHILSAASFLETVA